MNRMMDGWMDRQIDEWIDDKSTSEQMDELIDRQIYEGRDE